LTVVGIACCLSVSCWLIVGDAAIVGRCRRVIVDHDRLRIIVNRSGGSSRGHIIGIVINRLEAPAIQTPNRCTIDDRAVVSSAPMTVPATVIPTVMMVIDVVVVPMIAPVIVVPISSPVSSQIVPVIVPVAIPIVIPARAVDIDVIPIVIVYVDIISNVIVIIISSADDGAIGFLIAPEIGPVGIVASEIGSVGVAISPKIRPVWAP